MAQITLTRIKRIQFLLFMVVVLLLIFGGCGRAEETEGAGQTTAYVEPENMVVFMFGGVDAEAIGTSEWKGLDVEVPAEGGAGEAASEEESYDATAPAEVLSNREVKNVQL